jgi:hypothetical protein
VVRFSTWSCDRGDRNLISSVRSDGSCRPMSSRLTMLSGAMRAIVAVSHITVHRRQR